MSDGGKVPDESSTKRVTWASCAEEVCSATPPAVPATADDDVKMDLDCDVEVAQARESPQGSSSPPREEVEPGSPETTVQTQREAPSSPVPPPAPTPPTPAPILTQSVGSETPPPPSDPSPAVPPEPLLKRQRALLKKVEGQGVQQHVIAYDSDSEAALTQQDGGAERSGAANTAWCVLVPQMTAKARSPIAILRPAFALVMRRIKLETYMQPLQRATKEKSVCKITAPTTPDGVVHIERSTAAVLVAANRTMLPVGVKVPLNHGDEVSIFTPACVLQHSFTVMMSVPKLKAMLGNMNEQKRKLFDENQASSGPSSDGAERSRKRPRGSGAGNGGTAWDEGDMQRSFKQMQTQLTHCMRLLQSHVGQQHAPPPHPAPRPLPPPHLRSLGLNPFLRDAHEPQPYHPFLGTSAFSPPPEERFQDESLNNIDAEAFLQYKRRKVSRKEHLKRGEWPDGELPTQTPEESYQEPSRQVIVPSPTTTPTTPTDTPEQSRDISAITAELCDWVVPPSLNTVDLDDPAYPYYMEPAERVQIYHSLYLNISDKASAPFLGNTPKTLQLALKAGDVSVPLAGDVYCEALLKGMARSLGASFLPFDPTGLRSCAPTPSPLKVHGLLPAPVLSLAETLKRQSDSSSVAPSASALPVPFSSAPQDLRVGDRVRRVVGETKGEGEGRAAVVAAAVGILERPPSGGERGRVAVTFPQNSSSTKVGVAFDVAVPGGTSLCGACENGHGLFVDQKELQPDADDSSLSALFATVNNHQPLIVYIRSAAAQFLLSDLSLQHQFKTLLSATSGRCCFVIGSFAATPVPQPVAAPGPKKTEGFAFAVRKAKRAVEKVAELIQSKGDTVNRGSTLFPNKISVQVMPSAKVATKLRESVVSTWNNRLISDKLFLRSTENILLLQEVMTRNMVYCPQLASLCHSVKLKSLESYELSQLDDLSPAAKLASFTPDDAHNITSWAASHHLQNTTTITLTSTVPQELRWPAVGDWGEAGDKLQITPADLQYGISLYGKASKNQPSTETAKTKKGDASGTAMSPLADGASENEYEERLMADVIPADSLRVSFADIGALSDVKELVQDVVLQPLLRPGLYNRSKLTQPAKGLLLFGPPGTGKTMMAKAIAASVRASFLCISASSITSKWYGEGEKHASAVFSLAAKLSPCIIFIDEIDSLLGKRGEKHEHESSRRTKNEIMSGWDGMRSHHQVMVIGATNRPQDLDDAVLRRLSRRLLVDLPDKECRVEILKVQLKGESLASDVNLADVAAKTPGFSGSDLKTLCSTAAMRPIKRHLKKCPTTKLSEDDDVFVEREKRLYQEKVDSAAEVEGISQADFTAALRAVTATVDENAASIEELRKWNDTYGEQGSRNKGHHLSFYM